MWLTGNAYKCLIHFYPTTAVGGGAGRGKERGNGDEGGREGRWAFERSRVEVFPLALWLVSSFLSHTMCYQLQFDLIATITGYLRCLHLFPY